MLSGGAEEISCIKWVKMIPIPQKIEAAVCRCSLK